MSFSMADSIQFLQAHTLPPQEFGFGGCYPRHGEATSYGRRFFKASLLELKRNHGFFVTVGSLVLISSKHLSTLIYVPISRALFPKIAVIQNSEAWKTCYLSRLVSTQRYRCCVVPFLCRHTDSTDSLPSEMGRF